MKAEEAETIYDLLVLVGATDHMRYPFVSYMTEEQPFYEWRFQGEFGFGGKLKWDGLSVTTPYIDCYPEDDTYERLQKIAAVNRILVTIHHR